MKWVTQLTPAFLRSRPLHLKVGEERLLWLVRLRLVALFSQLPLTIIGRYYGYLDQASHIIFTLALILLLSYNAHLYRSLLVEKKQDITPLHLTLQITFDQIAFTFLLSISGGANNPFYAFFYVMAILGGIFSSGRSAGIFALTLVSCVLSIQLQPLFFSSHALAVIFSKETFPYLLSQVFIPFIAFLIARSFGELYEHVQKRLLALTIQNERLDRLRALGSLSAGFSHEFASPLQNAKLRLNRALASSPPVEAELLECKLSIEDCQEVLKRMNFSQLNFTNQDLEVFDAATIVKECGLAWQESCPHNQLIIKTQKSLIHANRINFVQALINLLDNAAEASTSGQEIRLSFLVQEGQLKIQIIDAGKGIALETLERIGEPFNTNKENGTGLGLYATQLFMNSVGGSLNIENRTPCGTMVELTFPTLESV
jgi:two-component system sensor histidine kinase RegB